MLSYSHAIERQYIYKNYPCQEKNMPFGNSPFCLQKIIRDKPDRASFSGIWAGRENLRRIAKPFPVLHPPFLFREGGDLSLREIRDDPRKSEGAFLKFAGRLRPKLVPDALDSYQIC